jgi:hypothetical protein
VELITPTSPDLNPTTDIRNPTPTADTPLPVETLSTPLFFPTITPAPLPGDQGIFPIQFKSNGTYVDIIDSISGGSSKTYSMVALQGQVMSISILQSMERDLTSILITVVGADGTTLCPSKVNTECYFWRGVLPASQEYLVKLTPVVDMTNFVMRVAINPPGTEIQSFQYLSKNRNVSFQYSDEFAPARYPEMYNYTLEREMALQCIDTNFFEGTNLTEAYFLLGASGDDDIVKRCYQPTGSAENDAVVNVVIIHGRKFVCFEWTGVWTGHIFDQVVYRTIFQSVCYEVTFLIHHVNAGNYVPVLKEFDHTALMQKFESIFSTIRINW